MPDNLNLTPLLMGPAIALGTAALGTPLLWRASRHRPRGARLGLTTVACVGLAGLLGLGAELFSPHRYEMAAAVALVLSLGLQLLLPILFLLSRKS